MHNFVCNLSTKILFGKDQISNLSDEIKKYGKRVLLLYGGGSVKKFGLYDQVVRILKEADIFFTELSGVKPNPRLSSVKKGVKLCHENNLDFILAVGGGSVIDCAKAIAAGFYHEGDPWDFYIGKARVSNALPIGSILTLSATGSEMNGNSVITNEQTLEKLPIASQLVKPRFSILDPTYTFTVPKNQTAAGTADIFSHICEQYFSPTKGTFVQDRLSEALFKACINFGPRAIREPENYEARANLMWASTLGLNGLLGFGKHGDWATHTMEHAVSAIYDVTHGVGLAILTPFWMEYVLDENTRWRFVEYAINVWGVEGSDDDEIARMGIERTRDFFSDMNLPSTLGEVGVEKFRLSEMVEKACVWGDLGGIKRLNKEDVRKIFENAL